METFSFFGRFQLTRENIPSFSSFFFKILRFRFFREFFLLRHVYYSASNSFSLLSFSLHFFSLLFLLLFNPKFWNFFRSFSLLPFVAYEPGRLPMVAIFKQKKKLIVFFLYFFPLLFHFVLSSVRD